MNYPENLRYSKDDEWIRVEGSAAYIGITDFAQSALGDIVFVDINSKGKQLAANEVFGSIEAVKTVADLYLPVGGTVDEVNPDLDAAPELVNQDPYGKGWIIKLTMTDPAEVGSLMDAAGYQAEKGS